MKDWDKILKENEGKYTKEQISKILHFSLDNLLDNKDKNSIDFYCNILEKEEKLKCQ